MDNKQKQRYDGNYVTSDGKTHSYRINEVPIEQRRRGLKNASQAYYSQGSSVAVKQKSSVVGKIGTFFSWILKLLQFLVSIAGLLLLIFAGFQVKAFFEKMQTVMELQGIISNLKGSAPIVQLQLVEAEMEKSTAFASATVKADGLKTFKVAYYNASGEIEEYEASLVSIRGKSIYIDCDVYNFTNSLIEKGEAQNIAIPYRIYSDVVAPEDGIILNVHNKNGIPYTILQTSELGNEDFYKLEAERLTKLMNIISDPEKAQELGIIRSRQKAAVANYNNMKLGTRYIVQVENNGGITLKTR